jgi:hypothetical protein
MNRALLLLLPSLLTSCAAEPVLAGMKRVDAVSFSVLMPESMIEVEVRPIDSYVREFKDGSLELNFDWGLYSDPLEYENSTRSEWTEIDGRRARRVEWTQDEGRQCLSAVHFPEPAPDVKLTLYLIAATPVDRELADRIFQSIRFKNRP